MGANRTEQLELVLAAWTPIFERFKQGEPDIQEFMDYFGPQMKTKEWKTMPITGRQLRETIVETPDTSAGLDHWLAEELKVLARWEPVFIDMMAQIINKIEEGADCLTR